MCFPDSKRSVVTHQVESHNASVVDDDLPTDVDPTYIENPFEVYVHDTMADYAKLHEATGWEPTIDFEEGVKRVCEPYKDSLASQN